MASWSQTFSVNNKYSLTLTVTEQSYSIPNNTSTVSYSLVMATAANSFTGYADYRTQISCSINGSSVFSYDASRNFNASAASSYSETLCSGTATVTHNADGTKSCAVTASVSVASGPYSPGSASISQSLTLTTIPRASTCSWSGDFVIGTAKTITITRASSSFNHKIKFTVGSASETLPSGGTYASTSYSWTPASGTYASQFPTQTSRTGTLVLYTYNSGTLIGSNSYTFTLKIPDAWKPSVSVTLSPSTTNAFIAGTGLYVAGYSKISSAITGTAATGAAISSYTISGAFSKTVNTSSSSTTQVSGVIATSGSKTVSVTITDARGRTGSASASCTYTAYAYPAVSSLSYTRGSYVGGVWTTSAAGTDLRITFTGSCSLSGNSNVMSWSIGSPVSTTGSGLTSGSSITRYKTGIGTTTAYSVTVTLTDSVGNSTSRSITVPTVEIPFVIDPTMPAIGVGAVPQTARTLELASNWGLRIGGALYGRSVSGARTQTPTQYSIIPVPAWDWDDLGVSSSDTAAYFEAWVKKVCATFPGCTHCVYIGTVIPNSRGSVMCEIYDTNALSGGLPQYCSGVYHQINGISGVQISGFSTLNYAFVYNQNLTKAFLTVEAKQSGSFTVYANQNNSIDINIAKTGFTPIGIVGITGSGNGNVCLVEFSMLNSTTVRIYARNNTSSNITVSFYRVSVLYVRD